MSSLSKREVFLLFLMAVIVTSSLFVAFLINPINEELNVNRERLNQLEFQKQQTEVNLSVIPALRTRKATRLTETETAIQAIADPLHASEFERWMLPVLTEYNARVTNVDLSDTTIATPELLFTQVSSEVYRLLELIQDYNDINVEPLQPLPESTTQMLFAQYSYQFVSSFENFIKIVDEVKEWNTTYFISNANYDFATGEGTITISVYGVQKITPSEVLGIYLEDFGKHPDEIKGPSVPAGTK
ncbi:MAG: hypothetical protein KGZ51_04420 [Erysipelothrix sp.]|jgi:hypothetical protein|nr:hypothetical protein [Erysipelothrix sp.]